MKTIDYFYVLFIGLLLPNIVLAHESVQSGVFMGALWKG